MPYTKLYSSFRDKEKGHLFLFAESVEVEGKNLTTWTPGIIVWDFKEFIPVFRKPFGDRKCFSLKKINFCFMHISNLVLPQGNKGNVI